MAYDQTERAVRRRTRRIVVLLWGVTLLGGGCRSDLPPSAVPERREIPTVYTDHYPLQYFTARIAGQAVKGVLPAPAGQDPAFWKPSPEVIRDMQKADLILLNGATYSKWIDWVSLPRALCVDTSAVFKDRYISVARTVTHSHGPGGAHSHEGTAFTTWLDFQQAAAQARVAAAALKRLVPSAADAFSRNEEALCADLAAMDERMKGLGARFGAMPLFASHPVYQYWARAYGLNVRMVFWEPDQEPDERMLGDLKAMTREHPARWMIWEGPPLASSVARLQALGIESTVFAPCGGTPQQGDFLSVMHSNLQNLEKILLKR